MNIKEIKKTSKKYIVTLDSGDKLNLHENVYVEFNLYVGKELDSKQIKNIKDSNSIEEYFSYILKRLILREYSPNKVEEILYKKGANKEEIRKILIKLRKYDFLNESKIVESVIDRCDRRHLGYNKIIKTLNDKKVSEKEIAKVKYDLNREEKEAKLQVEILLKKCKNKNANETKREIYQGLITNGFDEDIASSLMSNLETYNHIHEINVLKLEYKKYFLKYSIKYNGRELNKRITEALLRKGYRLNDIKEINHEMD